MTRATRRTVLAAVAAVGMVGLTSTAAAGADDEYVKYYTVTAAYQGKAENVTEIAERFLGDGARSAEVFGLNTGRTQPDGTSLTDGGRLKAGWVLVLPWDAYGGGVHYGVLPGTAATPGQPAPGRSTPARSTPSGSTPAGSTPAGQPPVAGAGNPTGDKTGTTAGGKPGGKTPGKAVRPPKECITGAPSSGHSPWAGLRIAASQAWPASRGKDQLVAVVDSGADGSLPQLTGHLTTGTDRATGAARGDTDCLGTGTAMAALIAAQPARGSVVTGVAPAAAVMPVRVVGKTPATSAAASAAGIRAAVAAGVSVIAIGSYVDLGRTDVVDAVNDAVDKGVVVVAGAPRSSAPSNTEAKFHDGVLRVGGIGMDGQTADKYRVGSVDVVAPGVNVTSLGITGVGTVTGTGTHYAVAFVAGQVALIRSAYPHLDPAQVRNRVLKTAKKMSSGTVPDGRLGWGQIDLAASVTKVLPEEARPAEADTPARTSRSAELGSRVALLVIVGLVALAAAILLTRRIRRLVGAGARADQPPLAVAPAGGSVDDKPAGQPATAAALGDTAAAKTAVPDTVPAATAVPDTVPAKVAVLGPVPAKAAGDEPDGAAPAEPATPALVELSRGPEPELSRDPALRHLAADEAGMAYLAEIRPEAREKALIGLIAAMDDDAVAAMPAMVAALPGTDAQEQALTGILADVRGHVRGDSAALERALGRAGKIRWQSQYELAEHVTTYVAKHPELEQLSTRIAETRWSTAGEPASQPAQGR